MKTHVAKNPERTRRAVVVGKMVKFFTRKPSKEHFTAPRQFWKMNCQSFEEAKQLADTWAEKGVMPQ